MSPRSFARVNDCRHFAHARIRKPQMCAFSNFLPPSDFMPERHLAPISFKSSRFQTYLSNKISAEVMRHAISSSVRPVFRRRLPQASHNSILFGDRRKRIACLLLCFCLFQLISISYFQQIVAHPCHMAYPGKDK